MLNIGKQYTFPIMLECKFCLRMKFTYLEYEYFLIFFQANNYNFYNNEELCLRLNTFVLNFSLKVDKR